MSENSDSTFFKGSKMGKQEFLNDIEGYISRNSIEEIYQYVVYDDHYPVIKIRNLVSGYLYHTLVKNPKSKTIPDLAQMLARLETPKIPSPSKPQLLYFLYYLNNLDLDKNGSESSVPENIYL